MTTLVNYTCKSFIELTPGLFVDIKFRLLVNRIIGWPARHCQLQHFQRAITPLIHCVVFLFFLSQKRIAPCLVHSHV